MKSVKRAAGIVLGFVASVSCSGEEGAERGTSTPSGNDSSNDSGSDLSLAPATAGGEDAPVEPVEPGTDFETCAGVSEEPENTYQPADIVFLVDNSPSMKDEIEWTRANLNAFSRTIAERGLAPHVVMVACLPGDCDGFTRGNGICIAPPLGSGDCETDDSNPPSYLHVDTRVPSQKLLDRAIDTYADWLPSLRPEARTHFVAISDDGERMSAEEFRGELAALDPPIKDFVFHSVYSSMGKEDACAVSRSEPCCTYAAPGGEGVAYRALTEASGGVGGDLCAQDFAPVFAQFAESVIAHSELGCDWGIPTPPTGQSVDPALVNLGVVTNGGTELLGYVPTADDCAPATDAWYYDDPFEPSRVHVCPATCERLRGMASPRIELSFGCTTFDLDDIDAI